MTVQFEISMTPEELCSAHNHSWLCLNYGYYCQICNRHFPLGIWANAKEDTASDIMEIAAKLSCPRGTCEI
ncbi:MAG TPA: hypothetical protein VJJ51_11810 [Candidatus Methanoperedens sp.]|nr:hypothetical protein [Candidatus Methanoperedens sp.]HLB71720.1 hypothetical protein [Candidatus Methanoperedens sp.]